MFKGEERYGEGDLAAMLEKASHVNSKGEARVIPVEEPIPPAAAVKADANVKP